MEKLVYVAKIIVSISILGAFFGVTGWRVWQGQDASLEIGALIAAFAAVWGYWLGSSEGSARKTELLKDDRHA